jgi:hypothetical protein
MGFMEASGNSEEQPAIQADPDFAPDWPADLRLLCARLFQQYDNDEIRGKDRLGDRSFDDAPEKVDAIKEVVSQLPLEKWRPPLSQSAIDGELQELMSVLDEMVELSSSQDDFVPRAENLNNRLNDRYNWFRDEGSQFSFNARVREAVDAHAGLTADEEGIERLRHQSKELEAGIERLKRELESSQEAVSQARQAAGESASEEQAAVYAEKAEDYEAAAKTWLKALGAAIPAAAAVALIAFLVFQPDSGSKDAHDFVGLGFVLFVIGLAAFVVRVCAQNFRVNRHLATVARSKQASISTFQRLVASAEDAELRSAVTLTLAQAVFAVEETGLVDGSGDHVTLVERALIPNLPKAS